MNQQTPKIGDVIEDIEFELKMGSVAHVDFDKSIQIVRAFHNELRGEMLQSKSPDALAVRQKQFQLNDMLITLVQEIHAELRETQLQLRELAPQLARQTSVAPSEQPNLPIVKTGSAPRQPRTSDVEIELAWLDRVTQSKMLNVEMDVRPVNVPIIGKYLYRVRRAFHELGLFYVRQLASKQSSLNYQFVKQLTMLIEQQKGL
jgi:hypothetical protein